MRAVVATLVLLLAAPCIAEENPPTVTPTTAPTPTTHARRAEPGTLRDMPIGAVPGFGVPGKGPSKDENTDAATHEPAEH